MLCLRVFGIPIRFSVPFFVILAWVFSCQETLIQQAVFGACLLHECGHLFMMALLHHSVRQITFYGMGIQIQTESSLYPFWQDGLVLLAGPVSNLLCAGSLWLLFGTSTAVWMQLGTGLLNLLPFRQLDGGAWLRLFLPEFWETILTGICFCLTAIGIWYGISTGISNPTYYAFFGFLILTERMT